jgi:alpha-N-acetylglucosaminidase
VRPRISTQARQAEALGVAGWAAPHHYLADAYNEMAPPPGSEPAFLASVSRRMYEGMAATDSEALMVTQGWFLSGVPRAPWTAAKAKAFLRGPPAGKLLVHHYNPYLSL